MDGRIDVWGKRAQVIRRFGEVTEHVHAAGALLVGLDGAFDLRTTCLSWTRTPVAYIPPGCAHALRVHAQRLAVIFLAPGKAELDAFARAQEFCPWRVQLLGQDRKLECYLEACWDGEILACDVQGHLAKLLGGFTPRGACEDELVNAMVENLVREPQSRGSALTRARLLGVQGSRARELIREHLGVSWQRLRRWERMRALSGLLAQGQSLTHAAHSMGFSDSSQLARDFRASFGVAPGKLFRGAQLVRHPERESRPGTHGLGTQKGPARADLFQNAGAKHEPGQ